MQSISLRSPVVRITISLLGVTAFVVAGCTAVEDAERGFAGVNTTAGGFDFWCDGVVGSLCVEDEGVVGETGVEKEDDEPGERAPEAKTGGWVLLGVRVGDVDEDCLVGVALGGGMAGAGLEVMFGVGFCLVVEGLIRSCFGFDLLGESFLEV